MHFFLGDREGTPKTNNDGIIGIPEAEFEMRVPVVFSIRDLLWKVGKKVRRINNLLINNGWTDVLGGVVADIPGQNVNNQGVGQANYGTQTIVLPTASGEDEEKFEDDIKFNFTAAGNIGFYGSTRFWNSFGIWCSPYFRELTGFDELIVRTGNVFGEDDSLTPLLFGGNQEFVDDTPNTSAAFIDSPTSLYNTFEEREALLITSDIPLPPERTFPGDQLRYVFAHFDFRGTHEHITGRSQEDSKLGNNWYLEGYNIIGMQVLDTPETTGFASLVLPTILPSINVRALLRRKVWNYSTNTYSIQEVPLLEHDIDQLVLRMNFTLQL